MVFKQIIIFYIIYVYCFYSLLWKGVEKVLEYKPGNNNSALVECSGDYERN